MAPLYCLLSASPIAQSMPGLQLHTMHCKDQPAIYLTSCLLCSPVEPAWQRSLPLSSTAPSTPSFVPDESIDRGPVYCYIRQAAVFKEQQLHLHSSLLSFQVS